MTQASRYGDLISNQFAHSLLESKCCGLVGSNKSVSGLLCCPKHVGAQVLLAVSKVLSKSLSSVEHLSDEALMTAATLVANPDAPSRTFGPI